MMKSEQYIKYPTLTRLNSHDLNLFKVEFTYKQAISLYKSSNYELALVLFETISYEDSKFYVDLCHQQLEVKQKAGKESRYIKARDFMFDSKFQEAFDIFKTIADYKSSQDFMIYCENKLKESQSGLDKELFEQGKKYFFNSEYEKALNVFKKANHYDESDFYITLCEKEIALLKQKANNQKDKEEKARQYYDQADQFYGDKNYQEAMNLYVKADEFGHKYAACDIGYMYEQGLGVSKNHDLAMKWYMKAANQGSGQACYNLAWNYRNVEYKYEEAMKWYLKADELGNDDAAFAIGYMYDEGLGVMKNYQEANKWYLKAANKGSRQACFNLGWNYRTFDKNYQEAMKWYLKADELGHKSAACNIGYMYEQSLGVSRNYQEAMKWYLKGANQGDSYACYNLAWNYRNVENKYKEAMKWYLKADELGHKSAPCAIGRMYDEGLGVTQDYQEAMKWYLKGDRLGDTIAACNIGYMYEQGLGVNKNYQEAMKWYLKGANQGDGQSCYNLAWNYRNVENKHQEAMKWYLKPDELGNSSASCAIGYMYDEGIGVTKNYQEAMKWYHKSASMGNKYACYNLGINYQYSENKYREALKWYKKASELGHSGAQDRIKELNKKGYF